MEFLADSWILWLMITIVTLVGMIFYRQNRRTITAFTSSDDFSVRTIFLNFRKGEGDLFIGFLIAMTSFSLFVAGLIRWVRTMVG